MSAFLEEYGKIIVVIIVIAALIGLAILFKSTGSRNATGSFDKFMGVADDAVHGAQQDAKNGGVSTGGGTEGGTT